MNDYDFVRKALKIDEMEPCKKKLYLNELGKLGSTKSEKDCKEIITGEFTKYDQCLASLRGEGNIYDDERLKEVMRSRTVHLTEKEAEIRRTAAKDILDIIQIGPEAFDALESIVDNTSYLSKLPKEDDEEKIIYDVKEKEGNRIEVLCSPELICAMDKFDDWLEAFKEHYNEAIEGNFDYSPYNNVQLVGMHIPSEEPRVDFRVDWSKHELDFRFTDEDSKDIIYDFIERIRENDS
ncbi:MAG: hypothetical protein V3V78_01035 [Candidatus Woesearchaeota archaeon]